MRSLQAEDATVLAGDEGGAGAGEPVVEWGAGPRPLLLLHGFSGGPQDLRLLGEALAARGYRAVAPTLPGHGAGLAGLAAVGEEDWLRRGLAILEALAREAGGPIPVVGFSAGGALAIRLAAARPELVARLVLLAPALALHGSSGLFRRLFRWRLASLLVPSVSKGPPDLRDPSTRSPAPPKRIPTRAAAFLDRLIRGARRSLPAVRAPVLVLWGARDAVVPRAAAEEAAARVGSGPAPLVVLEASAHQLALDVDRQRVFEEVAAFLAGAGVGTAGEGA